MPLPRGSQFRPAVCLSAPVRCDSRRLAVYVSLLGWGRPEHGTEIRLRAEVDFTSARYRILPNALGVADRCAFDKSITTLTCWARCVITAMTVCEVPDTAFRFRLQQLHVAHDGVVGKDERRIRRAD